jgi:adenylylsulfate kinase
MRSMLQPSSSSSGRVSREEKETHLRQRGHVIWLYGLSGSGKSTLGVALERAFATGGFATALLDGDEIRAGLNRGLGFSDGDRTENLRRAAEVARLLAQSGLVVICAFITPLRSQRELLRKIIGPGDVTPFFLSASFTTCARRDVKGLYAKAATSALLQFTGRDSVFEAPPAADDAVIDTETQSPQACLDQIQTLVLPRIRPAS